MTVPAHAPATPAVPSSSADRIPNLIVGVTSFGLNALCRGTDFAYRIDRPEVLDWINSH